MSLVIDFADSTVEWVEATFDAHTGSLYLRQIKENQASRDLAFLSRALDTCVDAIEVDARSIEVVLGYLDNLSAVQITSIIGAVLIYGGSQFAFSGIGSATRQREGYDGGDDTHHVVLTFTAL